jgi:hypothetical protein
MNIPRYVLSLLVTLTAGVGLLGAPPVNADPATPYPCEKEWLPPRPRTVCEDDSTSGSSSSRDLPVGPEAPARPGGPGVPGPDGPR